MTLCVYLRSTPDPCKREGIRITLGDADFCREVEGNRLVEEEGQHLCVGVGGTGGGAAHLCTGPE